MKEGYELIYERPGALTDTRMHYCPGCFHSTIHKLMMELIEELDIQDKTVGVCPVGCSVFAYNYMDIDMQEAAHGRAAAVATGLSGCCRIDWCFPIRAMVIWQRLGRRRRCMPVIGVRISRLYSSITGYTG